jgi:hypothetical protein
VPYDFAVDMAGQHDDQGSADIEADTARPAVGFAETMCGMPGPGQPRVVEPGPLFRGAPSAFNHADETMS